MSDKLTEEQLRRMASGLPTYTIFSYRAMAAEILELRTRLESLPADWHKDSSLETWFPFTARELTELRAKLAAYGQAAREPIGFISGRAAQRMLRGHSRFTCMFPEPTREYILSVYLGP